MIKTRYNFVQVDAIQLILSKANIWIKNDDEIKFNHNNKTKLKVIKIDRQYNFRSKTNQLFDEYIK